MAWVLAPLCLVVAAVAVVVAVVVIRSDDEPASRLQQAVALGPPDARRVLFTDWAAMRAELDVDLDVDSDGEAMQDLLDRGFEADLTSTSALGSSAVTMQEVFGFSPATLEWELFTQSETGAALVMRLGGGVTTDDVAADLRALGYVETDGRFSAESTVTPVTAEVTPELAFITLDADAGLVLASDTSEGVDQVVASVAQATSAPVPDALLAGLADPVSAVVYSGDEACSELALANADPSEQEVGESLVAQAGKVNPVTGFAMAAQPGGDVRVTMSFESDEQARVNADTRARLAAGPAPGQGGDFAERFAVESVTAEGGVVALQLVPVEGTYVLSDLSTGPLLFATC